MKFFHTADWHLGKIVQGVHMTKDQRYILDQFIQAVEEENPDAIIIAGDLYDRAVPSIEAVHLLNDVFERIVLQLKTPILAIAGNHDSPSRLHFGSRLMATNGCYIAGQFDPNMKPVVLYDKHGAVHFHLVPYVDPSDVRYVFQEEHIRSHNDAMEKIIEHIMEKVDESVRHVFVGHAFVTPYGKEVENTSTSERPLSIGGAEYVDAKNFHPFHYTALGHLHQAHYVLEENIQYSGSILKYSISEEHHQKGFNVVNMDACGNVTVERRLLQPKRDMYTVEASIDEILTYHKSDDYVFVRLTDEVPIFSPMEKIRSIYPNALHVERKHMLMLHEGSANIKETVERTKMNDLDLFKAFYKTVKGNSLADESEQLFQEVLDDFLKHQRESDPKQTKEVLNNEAD